MLTIITVVGAAVTALMNIQAPAVAQAPAGPPPTEVFLAPLTIAGDQVTVGRPENISNSPGYDNQPFFAPDGHTLFFTSARGSDSSTCGSPQTDVYRYDLLDRQARRVTATPECEYSPTVTPDGRHLSVVRVEADGTQRLWRFTLEGAGPSLVLAEVKPVGYHAWLDEHRLALFVLGQPATLQVADTRTGKAAVVASNIGQSIQRMPTGGVSFVQQAGERGRRTFSIARLTLENGKPVTRPLTSAVAGAAQVHMAWAPDGTLLMAHDGMLHAWTEGGSGWRAVADLGALGLQNVTRLAVGPRGDRIAIVATVQHGPTRLRRHGVLQPRVGVDLAAR
jgi:dipeptidyl aminopeptidase/acylaminoacyl peptidase